MSKGTNAERERRFWAHLSKAQMIKALVILPTAVMWSVSRVDAWLPVQILGATSRYCEIAGL